MTRDAKSEERRRVKSEGQDSLNTLFRCLPHHSHPEGLFCGDRLKAKEQNFPLSWSWLIIDLIKHLGPHLIMFKNFRCSITTELKLTNVYN